MNAIIKKLRKDWDTRQKALDVSIHNLTKELGKFDNYKRRTYPLGILFAREGDDFYILTHDQDICVPGSQIWRLYEALECYYGSIIREKRNERGE